MPKIRVNCVWCGAEIFRYASALGKHSFCGAECRRKFLSKKTNPEGYPKHEHLSEYNLAHNYERMTEGTRAKLRAVKLGNKQRNTYPKIYGRHEHRVIAEQMLGRKLLPEEIVHHIDGDKHNNRPDNLMVLPNQAAHIALHRSQGDLRR